MTVTYVNIFVTDLERAVDFYTSKLGLKLEQSDAGHGYASLDAGAIRLGLAAVDGEHSRMAGRHTGVGLAVDDLVAEHDRLRELGVRFTMAPERQPWGGFMAVLADPDGNELYLDEVAATRRD